MRRVVVGIACVAVLFGSSDPIVAHEQRPAERRLSVLIRHARAIRGLSVPVHGTRLHRFGRRQVERMVACECVGHAQPPRFCDTWGQAVGIGLTADRLFRAFMDSDAHRRIFLARGWRRIGVGAKRHDGLLYVAVELCR